jgi:hypothetical protein
VGVVGFGYYSPGPMPFSMKMKRNNIEDFGEPDECLEVLADPVGNLFCIISKLES